MKKIYIVRYSRGTYDSYEIANIFVTDKKSKATKYVTKFNGILKKWKSYYSQFEENQHGMNWLKDEHLEQHFNRWNCIVDIGKCYLEEIEIR